MSYGQLPVNMMDKPGFEPGPLARESCGLTLWHQAPSCWEREAESHGHR